MNFYYNLVAARSASDGRIKVHVFNSFFYSKLIQAGYGGVRRWTKKVCVCFHVCHLLASYVMRGGGWMRRPRTTEVVVTYACQWCCERVGGGSDICLSVVL